jgi:serine/threonine-protein kinase CTR1
LSSLGSKDRGAAFSAFKRELAVIYSCRHPSIVTVWGATTTLPDRLIMITELFESGTLRKLLDTSSATLTMARKLDLLRGVASGLEYLHSRSPPIFHRDLKSSNVLIDDNGKSKLIDFGLSKSDITMKTMTLETKSGKGGLQGTPKYMAPEIFESMDNYTQNSEVYSFGILTWEVLTGRVPWEGLNEFNIITKVSLKHERPSPLPEDVDAKLISLLTAMWHRDPNERPTFKVILEAFDDFDC